MKNGELNEYQKKLQQKFNELLPDLMACVAYGEATKIVRATLDKNFGKDEADCTKKFEVRMSCKSSATRRVTIEAANDDAAREKAVEMINADEEWHQVEVDYCKEVAA